MTSPCLWIGIPGLAEPGLPQAVWSAGARAGKALCPSPRGWRPAQAVERRPRFPARCYPARGWLHGVAHVAACFSRAGQRTKEGCQARHVSRSLTPQSWKRLPPPLAVVLHWRRVTRCSSHSKGRGFHQAHSRRWRSAGTLGAPSVRTRTWAGISVTCVPAGLGSLPTRLCSPCHRPRSRPVNLN